MTPRDNALVAAAVTNAARNVIENTVRGGAERRVPGCVAGVVVGAHERFVALVEDDSSEPVSLNLRPVVEQVDTRLEQRGIDLIDDATLDDVSEVVVLAVRRSTVCGRPWIWSGGWW